MSKTILLVDDEEPVRHMFQRMLKAQGYATIEASSAETGWDEFQACNPDLVITDLKMPGEDGLWLAQRIYEFDPQMPILLITAYADLGSAQRAVSLGIYEYFIKPVDLHQVLSGVQRGLEYRRLAQDNKNYQEDLERKIEVRTKELERVYQELLHTEKLSEVGRLAAGVVHEVLNPLSVVMGRIEMVMMDEGLDERIKQSLGTSREQLQRAVKIMNNLRNFSRQRAPQREKIDLHECLSETIDLVAYETKQAQIRVEEDFGVLPQIMADKDQLAQVFLNLTKNAIEAMPQGGHFGVKTVFDVASQCVHITFSDTGVGMPVEIQEKIFDLFFTTKETGTGLGLGICRGIIEAHGGIIAVNSAVGEGTSFLITLPVAPKGNHVEAAQEAVVGG